MAVRLLDLQLIYGLEGAREKFEELCAQLIRYKFPDAKGVRVYQGDGGIDTYVGKWGKSGNLHVFQVKFFPTGLGETQKSQVRESLKRCLANTHFRTVQWTLCVPLNLSVDETTWFENWKRSMARGSLTSDNIDCWGETALSELLFKPENLGIKEAFFQEKHLTQIREMHQVLMNLVEDISTRIGNSVREVIHQEKTSNSAFQTVEQFYQPFLNPDHLFHHTLPLIGRTSHLKTLIEFSHSQKQVALLSGADGVGKSRLLLEALRQIEKEHEDLKILMLRSTYTGVNEYELADGRLLIGVDDTLTTDKNHLDELFRRVRSYPDRIKLILAIRPEDPAEVKQLLFSANFQPEEILELPLLEEVENPIELAKAILGKEDLHLISQLVALASDSPLIMVIAGELLKRGLINHSILALSHDDFRQRVVTRYKYVRPGNITFPISTSKVQEIRALLYATGPFDTSNESLIIKVITFLQISKDEFLDTLDLLVKVGMIIRQRESYSSIPQALAYPLLEQACFTSGNRVKDFGQKIVVEFTEPWQTSVLKKLAEVDWLKGKGHDTGLLTRFWQQQNKQYLTGTIEVRLNVLRILNDVAYLQPKAALDFVKIALHAPDSLPTALSNDQSVREQRNLYLSNILGQVARHFDYLKEAITLLWDLGKENYSDRMRPTYHPHQMLKELLKPRYNGTVAYYSTYLECVETWCHEPDAFERDFTPLDLIPGFLERDGYEDYYFPQTQSVHMQHFQIAPEPMKAVRKQALSLLVFVCQMNEKPKHQYHTIEILCNIIVRGLTYHSAPELRAQWYEEDLAILTEITELAQNTKSAFIVYSIEYKLRIALKHPENAPLAENLHATLATLPFDLDTEIIWYLKHQKSAEQFSRGSINEHEENDNLAIRDVAKRVLQTYQTAQSLKGKLEDLCIHLALYDQQIVFPYFLELLIEINPALGCELCRLIVKDSSSYTVEYFTFLARPIRQWDTTAFLALVRDAMKSDNAKLRQSAVYAISSFSTLTYEESDIITIFIKDTDPIIATRTIRAIHRLPENKQDMAFSMLNEVTITSQDEAKVNAMCEVLHQQMNNPTWDPIPFITSFLQKCVLLPILSEQKHHRLCSFLVEYRWKYPQIVANFCLDRVKYRRLLSEEQQQSYEPTSFMSVRSTASTIDDQGDRNHAEERYKVLCIIRDEFLKFEEKEIIMTFAYLANGYDAVALRTLSEWLESKEEKKILLAAKLVQKAPTNFVFDNENFIEWLLSVATHINKSLSKRVNAVLLSSALPFGFFGVPDLLSNGRIQIRDRALQMANKYPLGNIMHAFYMNLSKEVEDRIEMQRSFLAG